MLVKPVTYTTCSILLSHDLLSRRVRVKKTSSQWPRVAVVAEGHPVTLYLHRSFPHDVSIAATYALPSKTKRASIAAKLSTSRRDKSFMTAWTTVYFDGLRIVSAFFHGQVDDQFSILHDRSLLSDGAAPSVSPYSPDHHPVHHNSSQRHD